MCDEPRMHLDDDEMSLQSKIVGGGRDLGEQASKQEMRLCPACGRVTVFVQGKCTNCDYKPGVSTTQFTPGYGRPIDTGAGANPLSRWLVIILVVLVVAAVAYFAWTFFAGKKSGGAGGEGGAATQQAPTGQAAPQTHAGGLAPVTIDDALHSTLRSAVEAGNAAWKQAGTDCYAYRYRVFEKTVPATSQTVSVTLFLGGADAAKSTEAPADAPMRGALGTFMAGLASHTGVEASVLLQFTDGAEPAESSDVYVRYGYYYGKEHLSDLQEIIDALEQVKRHDGQYPHALSENMVSPPLKTMGGFTFISRGYGYLPVFLTDSAGHIVMGEGTGLASYRPKECTGYYLFVYTTKESEGLDVCSTADKGYYRDHISRFPYVSEEPVSNVGLHPDGKPDGVACVVKNGSVVRD